MKFICIDDAIDSGDRQHLSKRETPITHNYRRERIYDIDEAQLRRLTAIGLFPEVFEYGDEAAAAWVEAHNDELCDIVDARVLPYRKLTAEEEANDRLVAKTGEGKFTLPHGVVAITRPTLMRNKKTTEEVIAGQDQLTYEASGPITLTRPEKPAAPAARPAPAAKKGTRKPMSAEARKEAGERLAAARAKKKEKATVGA
jgi:hypothetical protein